MKMGTAYYGALRDSGMPHQYATAIVNALEKEMTTALASKTDLREVRNELKADIADVRHEFKLDMTRLEANITTFRTEMKADMAEVRNTLEVSGERRSKELAKLEHKLTLQAVGLLLTANGLLFTALKYFN